MCVCVCVRVFYYFYFGSAIAWLISCPTSVTSVSRGTCKAHDKSGIFCMGHSYSARHNSERGSSGREGEGSRGRKIIDQIFCLSALPQQPAGQINRVAHPLPATLGALHLLLSGKQTNKFSALTPLPLAPAAMDHRQQQQQQQQSSPAALSAENGLQLQLGIMLCIFDMAQTAADPLYILPRPPSSP